MNAFLNGLTPEQLATLGGGVLGYVKEMMADEAKVMLGNSPALLKNSKLFCLYNADGTPISISGSKAAAISSAFEHDLTPASLH